MGQLHDFHRVGHDNDSEADCPHAQSVPVSDEWGGITVSGGVGAGVDIHASETNTETVVKFNPAEWIKGAWKKIKGVFA